jgi:hypothetical protein
MELMVFLLRMSVFGEEATVFGSVFVLKGLADLISIDRVCQ